MTYAKQTQKDRPSIFAGNKVCGFCGEEFKVGQPIKKEMGEYPVHEQCE